MPHFEQVDAFKVCHELTLALHQTAERLDARDPELAAQLWCAALFASGRIARGVGMGNRRMFAMCLERSLGALSEIDSLPRTARRLDVITADLHDDLESRRGRASCYVTKLLSSLREPPAPLPS